MTTVTNEVNQVTVTVTEVVDQYHVTVQQTGGIPLGGTTGQVLAKASSGNRDVIWTNPIGGGDMLSVVYDPMGIAADVFDLGNHVGNLDGGVFT